MNRGSAQPILEARCLTVRRGERVIVEGIDLALPAAGSVAVIGPNGGGKTSLLLALRGLLPATGSLSLCGLDPRTSARGEVAKQVAVVPQRNEFAFSMRVEEMVLLGRAPYRKPWQGWGSEDREIVHGWLARLGLERFADRPVDTLSGGERRRVFIARALVQETPILFLDEPFTGLDPAAQEEIGALLTAIGRESERTLVIVLHDLFRIERLCDQVLGIAPGRVEVAGACREVLDAPALERLFGVPWSEGTTAEGERLLVPRSEEKR